MTIGVGASAYVCPYSMKIFYLNKAIVRCRNGATYTVDGGSITTYRRLTTGGVWACPVGANSGSARITTQRA